MDPSRPLRFIVVGVWNTFFGWLAYVGFYAVTSHFGLSYLVATVPAQIVAVANGFIFQRAFVFDAKEARLLTSFLRFSLVYWALWAVNTPALALLVTLTHLDPRLVQALLAVANAAVSYFLHLHFTFRTAR